MVWSLPVLCRLTWDTFTNRRYLFYLEIILLHDAVMIVFTVWGGSWDRTLPTRVALVFVELNQSSRGCTSPTPVSTPVGTPVKQVFIGTWQSLKAC